MVFVVIIIFVIVVVVVVVVCGNMFLHVVAIVSSV